MDDRHGAGVPARPGTERRLKPGGHPFAPGHRRALEAWAADGCRISAYMLRHDVWFPDAIEALARRNPRPAVVHDIRDYRPADDA